MGAERLRRTVVQWAGGRRGKTWLRVGGGVALALLAFVAWQWSGWRARAEAGTAYAARIVCSCRYVQGRPLDACAQEVALDAGAVSLSDDPQAKRITGAVPLLGRASARWVKGYGCLMDRE